MSCDQQSLEKKFDFDFLLDLLSTEIHSPNFDKQTSTWENNLSLEKSLFHQPDSQTSKGSFEQEKAKNIMAANTLCDTKDTLKCESESRDKRFSSSLDVANAEKTMENEKGDIHECPTKEHQLFNEQIDFLKNAIDLSSVKTSWYLKHVYGNLFNICAMKEGSHLMLELLNKTSASIINQMLNEVSFNLSDFLTTNDYTKAFCAGLYSSLVLKEKLYLLEKVMVSLVEIINRNNFGLNTVKLILEKATSKEEQKLVHDHILPLLEYNLSCEKFIIIMEIIVSRLKDPFLTRICSQVVRYLTLASKHKKGYYFLKKIISKILSNYTLKELCLKEVKLNLNNLLFHQYGSLLIQHILRSTSENSQDFNQIAAGLYGQLRSLISHKYSDRVIEVCLEIGNSKFIDAFEKEIINKEVLKEILASENGFHIFQRISSINCRRINQVIANVLLSELDSADSSIPEKDREKYQPLLSQLNLNNKMHSIPEQTNTVKNQFNLSNTVIPQLIPVSNPINYNMPYVAYPSIYNYPINQMMVNGISYPYYVNSPVYYQYNNANMLNGMTFLQGNQVNSTPTHQRVIYKGKK